MSIAEKIQAIKTSGEQLAIEAFGNEITEPQVVEGRGEWVQEVTDLFGHTVSTSPQLQDHLFEVNGGANIHFGEHWLSAAEMARPFEEKAKYLQKFDPVGSLESAKISFFESLEDEVYSYQEAMNLSASGSLNEGEHLVLFGYNLVELGTRPTYLFFQPTMHEPIVWSSAVDWIQVYDDLDSYFDVLLS